MAKPTYFEDYSAAIKNLKSQGILPLYVVSGSEILLFQKFVEAVRTHFENTHGQAGEIVQRWGVELRNVDDFRALVGGGGLFSTATLLIVHNIENAGPGLKKSLAALVKDLPENTHVILRYEGDWRKKDWLEKVKKLGRIINVETPFSSELRSIVVRLAAHRELTIQNSAVDHLIQISGGDLSIIDQEIEKISLYLNGAEANISEEHVNRLSGLTEHSRADDFLTAIDHRDRKAAIQALKEISRQGNESLPFLAVAFGNHMTRLRLMKDSSQDAKAYRMPYIRPQLQRRMAKAAGLYTEEELEAALLELARIDRGTRLGTEDILTSFTRWVSKVL